VDEERFDDVARAAGQGVPRRKVLKMASYGVAAAFAARLGVGCSSGKSSKPSPSSTPRSTGSGAPAPSVPSGPPTAIYTGGNVITMNPKVPRAQAVAVAGGVILAVGTNEEIQAMAPPGMAAVDLKGATVLPGFIDPHSHMQGWSIYDDPDDWVDVSGINAYFKPPPGDSRCTTPDDPQQCFIPVRNHDDVVARLKKRLAQVQANPGQLPYVLGCNYDASRLGHSDSCPTPDGVGFECPNLEDGHAREHLDAISTEVPIFVTAQSGHFAYVNTPALKLLNICGTDGATTGCYQATTNPRQEIALANRGQLDEDLALYAIPVIEGLVLKLPQNKGLAPKLLVKAAQAYAQHGFTLAQEGAASQSAIELYNGVLNPTSAAQATFPVAAAMLAYDSTTADYNSTISLGTQARQMIGDNPLLSVAALKTFVDGSTQGYTADLTQQYNQWFFPFDDATLFQQPYHGLPDITQVEIEKRLAAAHKAGFPIALHQIGDAAITSSVKALVATKNVPPPPGTRDLVLHAQMITGSQLDDVAKLGTAAVSVMPANVHFFALPECQQVLGRDRTVNGYPAKSALAATGRVTLHPDSPVNPPDPLFLIWCAATRQAQQPDWYPNRDPAKCPPVMVADGVTVGDQRISILDGLKAFTVDGAWQYGMENVRGSLEPGKYADMVMLSADPLADEVTANPDNLKTIRVLGTVRYGTQFPNPNADQPPIWPEG